METTRSNRNILLAEDYMKLLTRSHMQGFWQNFRHLMFKEAVQWFHSFLTTSMSTKSSD